jgi:hypothetical protein
MNGPPSLWETGFRGRTFFGVFSFAPLGLAVVTPWGWVLRFGTHGLRRGLHSCAASRLGACARFHGLARVHAFTAWRVCALSRLGVRIRFHGFAWSTFRRLGVRAARSASLREADSRGLSPHEWSCARLICGVNKIPVGRVSNPGCLLDGGAGRRITFRGPVRPTGVA